MPTVTIRFVTDEDFISKGIQFETWSKFCHVEFVLDDGTTLGARAQGGVAIRPANYDKFSLEERYAIPCTQEQKDAILGFAHAQVGKPYDFFDIVGILTHRDWRETDRWICSELVAASFEAGDLPLLYAPSLTINWITPQNVYTSIRLIGNQIPSMIPAPISR